MRNLSISFFAILENFLILVIQQAVAVTLKIGVRNLLPEFLTNALIILGTVQPAGAIAAGALQAVPDGLDHFFVFIEPNCHGVTSFPFPL